MKLDGSGKPFITLAQFLKLQGRAEHGGAAKARVREGGVQVNGQPEERPGRKLHAGDVIELDGERLAVEPEHVGG